MAIKTDKELNCQNEMRIKIDKKEQQKIFEEFTKRFKNKNGLRKIREQVINQSFVRQFSDQTFQDHHSPVQCLNRG